MAVAVCGAVRWPSGGVERRNLFIDEDGPDRDSRLIVILLPHSDPDNTDGSIRAVRGCPPKVVTIVTSPDRELRLISQD